MRIEQISISDRYRKDLGDLDALAESMKTIGLLHPIVVTPEGELVAGARRVKAAERLGWEEIPHRVVDTLDDARDFLIAERDENVCRLDFTPTEAVALGKRLEELEQPAAKERQGTRTDLQHRGNFPQSSNGKTRDKVGAALGMSGKTYEKAKQVVEAAEEEPDKFGDLPERMNKRSIHSAYSELNSRQKRRNIQEYTQTVRALPALEKTYNVLYGDPPWDYGYKNPTGVNIASKHYHTMPMEKICGFITETGIKIAGDAVLFLWVTNPFLVKALDVVEAWGFEYKTNICWVKTNRRRPGAGHYVRGQHELLYICTRGSFTPLDKHISPPIGSVLKADQGEHSEKPQEAYEIIERLYPGCTYLELFARRRRDGWESIGNEA